VVSVTKPETQASPAGVPLGKEEGDPEELLTDTPEFLSRFDARLVELGRRFGLNRRSSQKGRPRTAPKPGPATPA
jgi:hypothetical protein